MCFTKMWPCGFPLWPLTGTKGRLRGLIGCLTAHGEGTRSLATGKELVAGCKVSSDLLQLILKSGHSESLDFKRLLLKRTRKAFCSFSSKGSRPWLIIYLAWTYKYKVNGWSSLIRETLFFPTKTAPLIQLTWHTKPAWQQALIYAGPSSKI